MKKPAKKMPPKGKPMRGKAMMEPDGDEGGMAPAFKKGGMVKGKKGKC